MAEACWLPCEVSLDVAWADHSHPVADAEAEDQGRPDAATRGKADEDGSPSHSAQLAAPSYHREEVDRDAHVAEATPVDGDA